MMLWLKVCRRIACDPVPDVASPASRGWELLDRGARRAALLALIVMAFANWLHGGLAMAATGLITVQSELDMQGTVDRLEAAVNRVGMTVFARVDHAAGAAAAGLFLRPTLLLIFGSAKGGTPLMQADPRAGIDLPLKALVYQDASGKVWLSYNDPTWIAGRHGLAQTCAPSVVLMSAALKAIVAQATEAH